MSAEERRKILQMVADGKISAEEAATLMRSLEGLTRFVSGRDSSPGFRLGWESSSQF